MNVRKKNEIQMERLEKLSLELEEKERELVNLQVKLEEQRTDLMEREKRQKKRENNFMSTWQSIYGSSMSNTTDDIMANLRDVMEEYTENTFYMRAQMEAMTAACCNAVSRIIEGGGRNGRELFQEEVSNALYASYIENRCFEDIIDETMLEHALLNIGSPEELERLGNYGFRNNVCLRRIELPEGLKEIPSSFFYGCARLVEVKIPDSVEKIGTYAFYGCTSLKKVTFGDGSRLRKIGDYAFALDSKLDLFTIPDHVTSVGMAAFRACDSLLKIYWPTSGSLKYIGTHMLQNCSAIEEITLPDSIMEIPASVFYGCTSLKSVTAKNVYRVEAYAFNGDIALREVRLGVNKAIDDLAFEGTDPELKVFYTSIQDSSISQQEKEEHVEEIVKEALKEWDDGKMHRLNQ